ncbi:MAG: FecR family protein [Methylophaga sp.]|nr:FecR family protein [Methylophaga sp.]
MTATLGVELFAADTLQTAANGAVGILLHDDARLSLGPDSTMSLDQFSFDQQSHEGQANISIKQGTLSVISGKLTEKRTGALQVKTPAAILAVRGTEFSVKVDPLLK